MLTKTRVSRGILKFLSLIASTTPFVNTFDLLLTNKVLTSVVDGQFGNFEFNHLEGYDGR